MIRNRLGVITDEVSTDLIEALDWTVKEGLVHVELRMINGKNIINLTDDELDWTFQEVKKRGLFVSAIASPLFKCALNPTRAVASGDLFGQNEEGIESHFNKLSRAFQIAKQMETNKIRIFSFWREKQPELYETEVVNYLRKAAVMAEENDIVLLLENEQACNGGYAIEVFRMVEQVNSSALKAVWDPGNEAFGKGTAFPDGYSQIKDVVEHVHLKDVVIDESGQPKCVPIGMGNVPFDQQIDFLERDGYRGLYTIETHYIPYDGTKADGTKQSLTGLLKIIKEG